MKRLIYIAFFMLPFAVFGQGLLPMQAGDIGVADLMVNADNELMVIHHDENGVYHLSTRSSYGWEHEGAISNLPNYSTSFRLKDAYWYKGLLYIAGVSTEANKNLVWTWDGSTWNNLSNTAITSSESLAKFIEFDGKLCLLGIFEEQSTNLLSWNDTSWTSLSGWVTYNPGKDYIIDAYVKNGLLYASGRFTRMVGPDPFYTAVYDGENWNSITHPPFLRGSNHFTEFNGQLVLSGQPNGSSDFIKAFNGNGWDDLSNGLEQYMIHQFWDLESHNGVLYLSGDIWNIAENTTVNLIRYVNGKWEMVKWPYGNERIRLMNSESGMLLYGEFDLFGISYLGQLSTGQALLSGRVFVDENGNCVMDEDEKPIERQMVQLTPGQNTFWTNGDGSFYIPVDQGSQALKPVNLIRYISGCPESAWTVDVTGAGNYELPPLGLTPKPFAVDLNVVSGFDYGYQLLKNEKNSGPVILTNNGTVAIKEAQFKLTIGEGWENLTFSPNYTFAEDGEYIWLVEDLGVDEQFTIDMSGVAKGDRSEDLQLSYNAIVKNPGGDINLRDNQRTRLFKSVETIDPIYKQCGNGSFFYESDPLNYYIGFSNVGSGDVKRVIVRDTLDEDVVISVYGVESYISHRSNFNSTYIKKGSKYQYIFTWVFDDINLPDSSSDPEGYRGYIDFGIHLASGFHPSGTEVCNQAEVFFDKQEPYETNEVCVSARGLGIPVLPSNNGLSIYPNPAHRELTIGNQTQEERIVRIYNPLGALVAEATLPAGTSETIQVANWKAGAYYAVVPGSHAQLIVIQ